MWDPTDDEFNTAEAVPLEARDGRGVGPPLNTAT
jgi:hypothetical protein